MLGATPVWPQGNTPSEEYRLKAAFVYRFPQFVEWPAPALNGHESVSICVVRPNPMSASHGSRPQAWSSRWLDRTCTSRTISSGATELSLPSSDAASL
jgi:hypothetical protein